MLPHDSKRSCQWNDNEGGDECYGIKNVDEECQDLSVEMA